MREAAQIKELILQSERIVITSHRSPDGDSIGSSLGLYRFIEALGKSAVICHPDACPNFLEWVKDGAVIHDFDSNQAFVTTTMNNADLIFCLDYNGVGRLGNEMGEILANATGKKVMIDHHLDPEDFADITVSEPSVCSTSQLVAELIDGSGSMDLLNEAIGTPLYLGIMTDTGSFRFQSVTARTHEIVAALLRNGVQHTRIHELTFDGNRLDKLKLRSYIIAERLELVEAYGVAIISVTREELERFHFIKGDTEGLVNVALSIEGVTMAAFFTENEENVVKISFRAKGDTYVNKLANDHFAGGGHKYASGGISEESLDATIERFKSILPNYVHV